MARGTWEDFTNKYGFGDGEQVEERDFLARKHLLNLLNDTALFKSRGVRAIGYDRPGMHNSCLVILLPNPDGKNDADLLETWLANELKELPDGLVYEMEQAEHPDIDMISEFIARAYDGEGG
jgi:hypothetical protein